MAKYEKGNDPLAGMFNRDKQENKKNTEELKTHEAYEEHDVTEAYDDHDELEEYEVKSSQNETKTTDNIENNDIIKQIARMVQEAQKAYETHEASEAHEVEYAHSYGATQGKKGKKLHRMSTGYTQPNWEFLKKESRKMGLQGGATELVNTIIDEYRQKKK